MHSTPVQHDDPQADLHHLAAILRAEEPSHAAHDPSELHINAADHVSSAATLDLSPGPALGVPPLNDNRELSHRAARPRPGGGFTRFLVATAIGVALTIGWQAYGEEAREKLATFTPQLFAASPVQAQSVSADEPPSPAPVQAAAEAEKPASATDTATAPQTAAPVQAASSAELTPLIEAMSHEIASLRQTVEQLKAAQQQISRDLAREQDARRKIAATAAAPKPVAAPPRNPPPPPPYSAAAAPPPPAVQQQAIVPPPPAPPQVSTVPGYAYVPRPPRPLP